MKKLLKVNFYSLIPCIRCSEAEDQFSFSSSMKEVLRSQIPSMMPNKAEGVLRALSTILSITNKENYLLVLVLSLPCAGDSAQSLGDD